MLLAEQMSHLETPVHWPFDVVLLRMGMAVAVGVLVGLEREHNEKTGVRTFSMLALLGCLGGLMGHLYAGIALFFVAMIILGMNYKEAVRADKLVLTTSAAAAVVGFAGVLFGQGHVFTPAVAAVCAAALLAWKRPISRFALGLSDLELKSAVLLAILTVIVLPALPAHPVDPWGLIEPRSNWLSVIVIAALGFANYILMKTLGARGAEVTAFFGGLVNSRKVIVELATRLREAGPALLPSVEQGVLLATGSMIIRNALVVAVLALDAFPRYAAPLGAMLATNFLLWRRAGSLRPRTEETPQLLIESPFKLSAALKFGLVFLALNVVGALAQRNFGSASFYFVCIAGGLLSSASSIASAATLVAHGNLPVMTGVDGIILSSLTSILANVPLLRGLCKEPALKRRSSLALIYIAFVGVLTGVANHLLFADGPVPGR